MELGQDIQTVPSVPYAPQPAAQKSATAEPSYASLYGQVGVPSFEATEMPASQEPSYGSMLDSLPTQTTRDPYSAPGSQRDIAREIVNQDVQAKKLLQQLAGSGSRVQRSMAEKLSSDEEDEQIAKKIRAGLDASEKQFEDGFDPNAGYANSDSPIGAQIKQTLAANWTRFKAGLARTDEGAMNVWAERYGAENVKKQKGAVWFRRNADEKFRKVDPEAFEFIGDTLLDGSGPIVEGLVSAMTEVGGLALAAGGAAATEVGTGGAATPGLIAAAPATVAGITAAAGATGAAARKGVMSLFGVEDEASTVNEMLWGAGLNAATLGLGQGLKAGGKAVVSKFGDVMSMLPKQRIQQLATIRNQFDDFSKEILGTEAKGMKAAGKGLGDAIERAQRSLDEPVELVYEKAAEFAEQKGIKYVPVDNLVAQLKNTLDENFIKFDDQGFAQLKPGKFTKPNSEEASVAFDMFGSQAAEEMGRGATEQMAEKVLTQKAFGSYGGEKALMKLAEDYNVLLASQKAHGGIPLEKLYDNIKTFRNEVDLFKNVPKTTEEELVYTRLQNAAASDRNSAFETLFKGTNTEEEKLWTTYFKNYSDKIDKIMGFKKILNQKESAEQFAKALVQPDNSARIAKLKSVVGEGSKEWNSFRGEWIDSFIQSHIDPNSGVLLTADMNTSLKGLGKEVVNELLSKEEQGVMNKIIAKGNKIAFTDLLTTSTKASIQDLLPLTMIPQYAPSRFKGLWNLIAGRKDAADYLLDEGFLKAAREATTKKQRSALLEQRAFFQKMVDGMKPVKRTITDPKTGKKVTYDIYIPLVRTGVRKAVDEGRREADEGSNPATYSVMPSQNEEAP